MFNEGQGVPMLYHEVLLMECLRPPGRAEARNCGTIHMRVGRHVAFLQETMLEISEVRDWNRLGRGFLEGFLAVNAVGCSGGVVIAWNPGEHLDRPF